MGAEDCVWDGRPFIDMHEWFVYCECGVLI